MKMIMQIIKELGIDEQYALPYGRDKAKISVDALHESSRLAPLVLVTAMSPTPAGEGKTTTSIGLADGLRHLGKKAVLALREPSMGPVFGMKGGATGAGKATLEPSESINLHFTGDFAAITAANNLMCACVDNALHFGQHNIDPRHVYIRRCLDVNDRALRNIVTGLGKPASIPQESGFDITAASQIMATFCMADSLSDLKKRLSCIVVARAMDGSLITVDTLGITDALVAILREAFHPNLVTTQEGTPAFVHGGPFANIAHGCNSVVATLMARTFGDIALTEAGFGADLGAEKYLDILSRDSRLRPDAAVLVVSIRALKYHGRAVMGNPVPSSRLAQELEKEDIAAMRAGMENAIRHAENLRKVYHLPTLVVINRFPHDTQAEIEACVKEWEKIGLRAVVSTHVADGGEGASQAASALLSFLDKGANGAISSPEKLQKASREEETISLSDNFAYPLEASLEEKIHAIATKIYHAEGVTWAKSARKQLRELEQNGFTNMPICIAKTQYSFTCDPSILGAPIGHDVHVRELRLSAGAGFVVAICGDIMTMPGLPRHPSAMDISVDGAGQIHGLH